MRQFITNSIKKHNYIKIIYIFINTLIIPKQNIYLMVEKSFVSLPDRKLKIKHKKEIEKNTTQKE